MTTEQPKSAPPQDHPFPPPPVAFAQHYNGAPYHPPGPPGAYPPPFFAPYPPPADGNHAENGSSAPPGAPYMMFHPPPPGMVYAYSPPQGQGYTPIAQNNQVPSALSRPKRKQVKMACTNCAAACKRCDEHRPCERCMKYGVADSCVDGQRKERKKGIKRGPYKRKNKANSADSPSYGGNHTDTPADGEWAPGGPTPATTATTTAAAMQAVAHQFPPADGFYPVYYPPFMPHPHEGQPGQDGAPPHGTGQPPVMPYYIPGYPPPYYPMYPPGVPPPHPHQPPPPPQTHQPTQVAEPMETATKANENANGGSTNGVNGAQANNESAEGKKRLKPHKGGVEPKTKKAKNGHSRGPRAKDEGAVESGGAEVD